MNKTGIATIVKRCFDRPYVAGAALGLLLCAAPARAQISRAEIEALIAPGAPNFSYWRNEDDHYFSIDSYWGHVYHNYARVLTVGGGSPADPTNVQYVTMSGPANSYLRVFPYFAQPIAAGSYNSRGTWTDNCGHAHFAYALFDRVRVYNGRSYSYYYRFRASEGMIGRRMHYVNGTLVEVASEADPNAMCSVNSDPAYTIDPGVIRDRNGTPTYTWKNPDTSGLQFVYSGNSNFNVSIDYYFVAMQGASHGWGTAALRSVINGTTYETNCSGVTLCYPDVAVSAWAQWTKP